MKELSPDLLDDIVDRLTRALHPTMIYLFGSHAHGNADRQSDVDLLVVVGNAGQSRHDIALKGRASLRDIMIPFDLVICTESQMQKWADVKCTLIYTVTRKGKLIYESEGRAGKTVAHAG
jgi:predicted nucleotidyltransferase